MKNLTGQVFGKLKVVSRAEPYISPKGVKRVRWNVVNIGTRQKSIKRQDSLLSGKVTGQSSKELTWVEYNDMESEFFDEALDALDIWLDSDTLHVEDTYKGTLRGKRIA